MFKNLLIIILLIYAPFLCQGANLFLMTQSVRGMGMGGAYVSVVNDADALLYNPASLARISGMNWRIIDLGFGVSNLQTVQNISQIQGGDLSSILDELYGKPTWIGVEGSSTFTAPYFGFGVYNHLNLRLNVSNPAYPNLKLDYINDLGYSVGFAFPVIPKFFYGGFTVRKVTRVGASAELSGTEVNDSAAINNSIDNTGNGFGFDLGFNLTPPIPGISPVFSFVWRDVGNTVFTGDDLTKLPPEQQGDMIVGASLNISTPIVDFTPAVEVSGLTDNTTQIGKKLKVGAEFDFPLVSVRGGFHQGYYTLGTSFSMGVVQFDFATYGVELGTAPGQQEDRRYVLQMVIEIGAGLGLDLFDGSNGQKGGGRRSQLKQRR